MRGSLGSSELEQRSHCAVLSIARGVFRREMQRLIGYFQPSGSLNYVAECQSPADSVLREGYDVLVPGAHLHRLSPDTQVRAAKSLLCPLARLRPLFSCRLLSYMTDGLPYGPTIIVLHLLCLSRDPGNGPGNPTQT